jgi:CBS domain containing-hemolysin-like protein
VDEFGGTSGLITLEDVLAELLGDVGDEFKAGEPSAETLPDGRFRLPGQMPVDDAATFLNTKWETDAATVNGLVTQALGHLPTPGERVTIGDFEFEVEDVRRRALVSALARRLRSEVNEEEQT